jgi:lipopolysaccharide biosynthesis protein
VPDADEQAARTAPLHDALSQENAALRDRVELLELTLAEYRRQMDGVLTSSSWRITSPLRMLSGRWRRLRAAPRRLGRRHSGRVRVKAPTTGLFPPQHPSALPVPANLRAVDHPTATPVRSRRVLVVAHVYYPELWGDIADRLVRIPEPFDLVVTLVPGRGEVIEREIVAHVPHAQVLYVPNRGRDIAPLLDLAGRGVLDGYDAVLKVHTKRSPHRLDGDAWRLALLDGVLESPEHVGRILELLRADPDTGLVVPAGHVGGPSVWGGDLPVAESLAARLPMSFDPDSLRFPAGSMYWARPWLLRRLLDLGLTEDDFVVEAGHTDGTLAHALERFVGVMAQGAGLDVVETSGVASRLNRITRTSPAPRPRVVAAYLPQFHRIAENDQWWGEGYTDWHALDRTGPLFTGHRQPDLPGELGRYDLADADVLRAQASLARSHGDDAFMIYHYWFDGRRLLERPVEALLADPTVEMPFALCWANENWTRRWDGLDDDVLMAQTYRDGWAESFFKDLVPAMEDPRYVRVGGLPVLVVYRPGQVPALDETAHTWRAMAADAGLGGLHLLGVMAAPQFLEADAAWSSALDGVIALPPAAGLGIENLTHAAPGLVDGFSGGVLSYPAAAAGATAAWPAGAHPGVMPGWDNTPRRGPAAWIFQGANPLTFRSWLRRAAVAAGRHGGEPFVFVNAWNEWGEGAHLEPCRRFGRGNLETVLDALGPVVPDGPGGLPRSR